MLKHSTTVVTTKHIRFV